MKFFNWLYNTFPPKEFMLRSTGGIKYFKLGTAMQIILISLLVTTGFFVGLFTYKMQFLQTVNFKQNVALKDLRIRYVKFTKAVVSLREELYSDTTKFTETDLNVELQIKKITKLLDLLQQDLQLINQNNDIKKDHKLLQVKDRLESIINEKKDREKMLSELDNIINSLQKNIEKIYKQSNDRFYLDTDFKSVFYNIDDNYTIDKKKNVIKKSKKVFLNLDKTIEESIKATSELKMLNYNLALQKEKEKYYYELNNTVRNSTLKILENKISFLENIFTKTRSYDLSNLRNIKNESEIGGPLVVADKENEVAYALHDRTARFELLREIFLSVPLAAPINKYYITSSYGYRKDPYTKRRAFHKGIDLGAAWGSDIVSTAAGKVSFVGNYGSYGKSIFIHHGNGIQTRYAHLSKIFVKKGETVDLGNIIGKIGNTGRSTGKHLHYEIKVNDKARNPYPFLKIGKNVFKKL
ncbi:MAG: hypothetical protein CMJ06_04335 [Pelagibacterales bacterium]|nr:hypothetical protein [Pelagibacterales bacterium]OUU61940.1 MAG: hypothetical protein CBC22_05785 [Alphaproteobacteria bacterium TMED62]|tara:strand:+ start:12467 stop:13867 length:1401 start_codon:yes stop_codon:yes gene_type:complete